MINPENRNVMVQRAIIPSRQGEILLMQRGADKNNNPSLWEFPGGKQDPGEHLLTSLKREVREETGLPINPFKNILHQHSYTMKGGKYDGGLYICQTRIATTHAPPETVSVSDEHEDALWVKPHEAAQELDLTDIAQASLTSFLRRSSLF